MSTNSHDARNRPGASRPSWLRFRLRTLMAWMLVSMIALGWFRAFVQTFANQRAAAEKLTALGAEIQFRTADLSFLSELLGGEPLLHVVSVKLEHRKFTGDDLAPLADLPSLERLYLASTPITDEGLRHVRGLKRLRRMSLWRTKITEKGLAHLARLRQLEVLDIHYTELEESALELFRGHPQLQRLIHSIRVGDRGIDALASIPQLRVESLTCVGATDDGLRQASSFDHLIRMSIDSEVATDTGLKQLCRLQQLKHLSLRRIAATDEGVAQIAGIPSLQSLDIEQMSLKGHCLQAFRGCPAQRITLTATPIDFAVIAPQLGPTTTILGLRNNGFHLFDGSQSMTIHGQASPGDLKHVRHFSTLQHLMLEGAPFKISDADFLKELHTLTFLKLTCACDDADAKVLGSLASLKALVLNGPQSLTPIGYSYLAQLPELTTLELPACGLADEDTEFLSECSNLALLEMPGNSIGSDTLRRIANSPNLRRLNVSFCPNVDDEAFRWIASLPNLVDLSAQETKVTDVGAAHLFGHPLLLNVTVLGSQVTPQCLQDLRQSLPQKGGSIY